MAFIAGTAKIIGNARLGKSVSVLYGAVIRGGFAPITIGGSHYASGYAGLSKKLPPHNNKPWKPE